MSKIAKLQEKIRELVKKELEEATTTGDIAGYETPHAFTGGPGKGKKKKKEISTNSTGYSIVKESFVRVLERTYGQHLAKQGKKLKVTFVNGKPILKVIPVDPEPVNEKNYWGGAKQMIKLSNSKLFFDPATQNFWLQGPGGGPDLEDDPIEPGDYDYKRTIQKLSNSDKSAVKKSMRGKGNWKESVNEDDLGLTYKKGKTVKVKHKTSGKSLVIIDKPNVRKEYEKLGFYAESINESDVFTPSMVKKAIEIAKSMSGNMTGAVKKIEKIHRLLSKNREVADALRIANESVNEAQLKLTKDKKKKISSYIWAAPKRIMTKRAWLRIADYNKLRKNGVDYVMTNMDGKGVFLPVVFESVSEAINHPKVQKQANQLAKVLKNVVVAAKKDDRKLARKLVGNIYDIYNDLDWTIQRDLRYKESVNEGRYHDYRNDESLSPKQKIGRSMREVRDGLNNLENLVKMNVKLKNELNVNSQSYWKNTHKALNKISERLVKLANKVGQLQ